jgi:hypothetical protein
MAWKEMMKMIRDGRTGNRVSLLIMKLCTIKMVCTTTTKMMMMITFKLLKEVGARLTIVRGEKPITFILEIEYAIIMIVFM